MTLTILVIRENTTRIITVFSRIFDFSSIIVSGYFMHMEFAGSGHGVMCPTSSLLIVVLNFEIEHNN